jgi:hypothetical protein
MFRPTYEQVGQKEAREVVDLHHQRNTIAALLVPRPHHPGVVDQNIQTIFRLVDLFGESSHRLERRHVHKLHHHIFVPRFSNYLLPRVVGSLLVATRQNHSGAPLGEVEGRLESYS